MPDLQILQRPGVIRERPEGNAVAISALLIIFRGLVGADPRDNDYFIECFEVTAPRRIDGRATGIYGTRSCLRVVLFARNQ
jgi:hypothetical protein